MLLFISMESTSQCEGVLYHTTSFIHSWVYSMHSMAKYMYYTVTNYLSEPINIAIDKMK